MNLGCVVQASAAAPGARSCYPTAVGSPPVGEVRCKLPSCNHRSRVCSVIGDTLSLQCDSNLVESKAKNMARITPIPFSDPPWLNDLPSPYYNDSHRTWQKTCRAFIDENLNKHAMDWEREETVPGEVWAKFARANFLVPSLPAPLPVKWLKRLGVHEMPGGLKVEDWDYMHTAIYTDEVRRHCSERLDVSIPS